MVRRSLKRRRPHDLTGVKAVALVIPYLRMRLSASI